MNDQPTEESTPARGIVLFGNKDAMYVREYRRGWTASERVGRTGRPSRKFDSGEYGRAWEDGYLDHASGRDFGHLATCTDHDACG